jgi:hypothetical protein
MNLPPPETSATAVIDHPNLLKTDAADGADWNWTFVQPGNRDASKPRESKLSRLLIHNPGRHGMPKKITILSQQLVYTADIIIKVKENPGVEALQQR